VREDFICWISDQIRLRLIRLFRPGRISQWEQEEDHSQRSGVGMRIRVGARYQRCGVPGDQFLEFP
jgi:hypothetical protein